VRGIVDVKADKPRESLVGAGVVALGVPAYEIARRRGTLVPSGAATPAGEAASGRDAPTAVPDLEGTGTT
jgi:hypothetical protein